MIIFVKLLIILIFVIRTNFIQLFVIIKIVHPKCVLLESVPSSSRNDNIVQVEDHGMNIENKVNDPMEEDEINNTYENDDINRRHVFSNGSTR